MRETFVLLSLCLLGWTGPGGPTARAAQDPIIVAVSIPPLAFLAERIGAPHVSAVNVVPPGRDPHAFEPTPGQIVRISRASAYFRVGIPFEERLLAKLGAARKRMRVVDVSRGIPKRQVSEAHETSRPPRLAAAHAGHDPDGEETDPEHAHVTGADPHVWLSPPLLRALVLNMATALSELDPEHADDYQRNLQALLREIEALHADTGHRLADCVGRTFYVFHPSFGYFADAYGLKQKAVELDGKLPSPRQLAALIKSARAEDVRTIFVQPQFDRRSAETIAAAIGGAVVNIDPLRADALANIRHIAEEIAVSLGK